MIEPVPTYGRWGLSKPRATSTASVNLTSRQCLFERSHTFVGNFRAVEEQPLEADQLLQTSEPGVGDLRLRQIRPG